ncbi:TIGR02710 family CRISPR-associated CARF protein [Thermodesulfatator atlanticus]
MKKVLILTVGGSCEPLVNAIKARKPDYTIFVCSQTSSVVVNGPGEPCKPPSQKDAPKDHKWRSIVAQTSLNEDQYDIIELSNPDTLDSCYQEIVKNVTELLNKKFPGESLEIIANYTGGTKTMSVALALAALNQENWDLELNKGPRVDLVKVRAGDVPVLINKWEVFANHQLKLIENLWAKFYYAEAVELAQEILTKPLSGEKQNFFQKICTISEAFESWDRFEHQKAYELLKPFARYFPNHIQVLANIVENKGYSKVKDLLMNAKRRATQKRFDDAVARLYRAVEMMAQIRLKEKYTLDTGNISLNSLPKTLQEKYKNFADEKGKIQLGLARAYEVLDALEDPLGYLFMKQQKAIQNALKKRNYSILAHGENPVTENIYNEVQEILESFLNAGFEAVKDKTKMIQLPTNIQL